MQNEKEIKSAAREAGQTMTESQAIEWVYDQDESSGDVDQEQLEAAFAALHGREANDDDRRAGLWSLCCAASPNCGSRPAVHSELSPVSKFFEENGAKFLHELPDSEFSMGGMLDAECRAAGFASGRDFANSHNMWNSTVFEAHNLLKA